MDEIKVMIVGLFMLVAPIAYFPSSTVTDVNAAVAVEGGEAFDSVYDVDIPLHHALMSFTPTDVKVITDPQNRVTDDGELDLAGDRIQFGNMKNTVCEAVKITDAKFPAPGDSLRGTPRLTTMLKAPELRTGARPGSGTDFTQVKPEFVAAWVDMPVGILRAKQSDEPEDDEVEFRPSGVRATLAKTVLWRLKRTEANCVRITPFADPDNFIDIEILQKKMTFTIQNVADESTGNMVPGVGYDFELLYRLLTGPIILPPLPYAHPKPSRKADADDGHVHGGTGVNCGPVMLP
jgi:hypothetical protein